MNVNHTWSKHWDHPNANTCCLPHLKLQDFPLQLVGSRLSQSLGIKEYAIFCYEKASENEVHFVLEYTLYNSTRNRFHSLFQNAVRSSLKSFLHWTNILSTSGPISFMVVGTLQSISIHCKRLNYKIMMEVPRWGNNIKTTQRSAVDGQAQQNFLRWDA